MKSRLTVIEQQGLVVAARGGTVRVRVGPTTGCSACDSGAGCGAGIFAGLLARKPTEFTLADHLNLSAGQPVMVGIPASTVLVMVILMYGLPLLAGLTGAGLGHGLAAHQAWSATLQDIMALVTGLGAGAVVLMLCRPRMHQLASRAELQVIGVINRSSSNSLACSDSY